MKRVNDLIKESDLHLIWSLGLYHNDKLMTEDSAPVLVEFPGIPSAEGGPDFRFARIFIGGELRIGSVELHLYHNGWTAHQHQNNLQYSNIVLEVCLFRSEVVARGSIPVLILEPYLKESLFDVASHLTQIYPQDKKSHPSIGRILDAYGDTRIRTKINHLKLLLEYTPLDELLYRELMATLGYKHNKAQFYELAKLAPYEAIRTLSAEQIENLLLEKSGLRLSSSHNDTDHSKMAHVLWRKHCVRPTNYPEHRIKAAGKLFSNVNYKGINNSFSDLTNIRPRKFVAELTSSIRTSSDNLIGKARAQEMVFNVIIPFFIAQAECKQDFERAKTLYNLYKTSGPPSDNFVTRYMKNMIYTTRPKIDNVRQYMGLLQLYSGVTMASAPKVAVSGISEEIR